MTIPFFGTDPLTDQLRRYYQNLQQANAPAAADGTSVLNRQPTSTPAGPSMSPAGPRLPGYGTPRGSAAELNPVHRTSALDLLNLTGLPQVGQLGYKFGQQVDPNANLARGAMPTHSDLPGAAGSLLAAGMMAIPGGEEAGALERVGEAAIRADGKIFSGASHFHAVQQALAAGVPESRLAMAHEGFLTSTGRYVDRAEAQKIAVKAKQLADPRAADNVDLVHQDLLPLDQQPGGKNWKPVGDSVVAKGVPHLVRMADDMRAASGATNLPRLTAVNAEKHAEMAKVYASLPKHDPAAKSAYDAMNAEVSKQYKALQDAGYSFNFVDHNPYPTSKAMVADMRDNKNLNVFKTPSADFHPYMTPEQNDQLRAVHDALAHAGEGHSFGPIGEENAYRVHASTLSPEARRALATETRGQNSWVNFGPNAHLPVAERPFAEQKAALWPEHLTGDYDGMTPKHVAQSAIRTPDGRIYTGMTHYHALERAAEATGIPFDHPSWEHATDGFTADNGAFLTRGEAFRLGRKAGQVAPDHMLEEAAAEGADVRPGELTSETMMEPGAMPPDKTTRFSQVPPEQFHNALSQFADKRPDEAGFMTWRTPQQMHDEGMRTFLSPDQKTGYAIHPETGDIRNVFNHGAAGAGAHAVADAVANNGGKVLDAFDTNLGNFYRDMGFKESSRMPWDDQYAPHSWNTEKYGRPDVIAMEHPLTDNATKEQLLSAYNDARSARKSVPKTQPAPATPSYADQELSRLGGTSAPAPASTSQRAALERIANGLNVSRFLRDEARTQLEALDSQAALTGGTGGARTVVGGPAATGPTMPPQTNLRRFVGNRIDPQRVQDVEDEAHKTFTGSKFSEWLQNGNFPDWYDTKGTQSKAVDALGEEDGPAAFTHLMNMMGATTARSDPANNLRRASYYRALDLAGLLHPDELRGAAYKAVPTGMGHLANNAHHAALARLLEDGGIDPITNPKPAAFVENLKRNFLPYTNDTRMATGSDIANPKLTEMGALVKSVTKDGTTISPRNWAYAPMERAMQRAAEEYQGKGMLDVPAGAHPTAFAQAKIWDGLGPLVKGSPSAGTFDDVFNKKLAANAASWGMTPAEANAKFWAGHPFDLPLRGDVVPKGLIKRFLK